MAVTELFTTRSRNVSVDREGMSYVTVFQVDVSSDLATSEPGIPQIGSSLVVDGRTVTVDALTSRPTGRPDISEVEVAYSNTGRYAAPERVDDDDLDFHSYAFTTQKYEVQVPVFRVRIIEYAGAGGAIQRRKWDRDDMTITVGALAMVITVNVETLTFSDMVAVANQTGMIHKIASVLWEFQGGNSSLEKYTNTEGQIDSRHRIEYRWVNVPRIYAPSIDPAYEEVIVAPTETLFPFDRYLVVPGAGVIDPRPTITVSRVELSGRYVQEGWLTLPGNPIR